MSLASLSGVGALSIGISPVNSRHTPFFGGLFDEAVSMDSERFEPILRLQVKSWFLRRSFVVGQARKSER